MDNEIEILENAIKLSRQQFEELGTHTLLQEIEMKAIEDLMAKYKKEIEAYKILESKYPIFGKEEELFELFRTNKKMRKEALLSLNVALQQTERYVLNKEDIKAQKIAVVSLESELEELTTEKDKLLEKYNERVQEIIDLKANSIPKSKIEELIRYIEENSADDGGWWYTGKLGELLKEGTEQ